ncbi:hypothetical protein BRD06_03530 [Halobacteriales archaeon QS_9_67_15]|nr:MAG: hypothetical protein BRD06_03530 [Halobacteriales archaeon QS_9_67_15]
MTDSPDAADPPSENIADRLSVSSTSSLRSASAPLDPTGGSWSPDVSFWSSSVWGCYQSLVPPCSQCCERDKRRERSEQSLSIPVLLTVAGQ